MASNTLLFRHQVATDIKKLELCPGRDFRIGIRDSFPFPSLLLPGESHTQFTPSIGRHEGPSKTSNNPDRNCRQGWRHHLYRRHQDKDAIMPTITNPSEHVCPGHYCQGSKCGRGTTVCHTPIDKLSNPFKTEWKDHVANKDNKVYFDPKCVKTMGSNWSRTRPTGTKNQPPRSK